MSPVDAVKSVFTKYADFKGRSRRSEYWWFCLCNMIISGVLSTLAQKVGGPCAALSAIYSLAVLVPSLAVLARRLHDIGKSGWWMLLSLVPLVGAIILIIWLAKDGQPEANQYGVNPKSAV